MCDYKYDEIDDDHDHDEDDGHVNHGDRHCIAIYLRVTMNMTRVMMLDVFCS